MERCRNKAIKTEDKKKTEQQNNEKPILKLELLHTNWHKSEKEDETTATYKLELQQWLPGLLNQQWRRAHKLLKSKNKGRKLEN